MTSFWAKFQSVRRRPVAIDVAVNYLGAAINALVPLIAIPFLVRALGKDYWGLVSFAMFLVSVMSLLNTGIAQSMIREYGERWSEPLGGKERAAHLLRGFERLYWLVALGLALVVAPFSGWIATRWLETGDIPHDIAAWSVGCALALFFAAFPASLYRGVLQALHQHKLRNLIQSSATLLKGIGGVVIAMITQSVLLYLIAIVAITLIETLIMALCSWRLMPLRRTAIPWKMDEVRKTLGFSLRMSGLVLMGVLTVQLDRFFVSSKLPIEQLGIYSIALSLALGMLQIGYPIFTVALPRLVAIGGEGRQRARANLILLQYFFAIIALIGLIYVLFGDWLLLVWLGDPDLVADVSAPLDWLMLSSALNTIYNIGYTNWVSMGRTRWITMVNTASLLVALTLTPWAIDRFGLVGAASSLMVINAIGSISALIWLFNFHWRSRETFKA